MWPNPQFPADLVTFTEEILNGKLRFFVQCKFWYSDQVFSRNIFTIPCLKSDTSEYAELAITLLYILLVNILTWYQLEIYIKIKI